MKTRLLLLLMSSAFVSYGQLFTEDFESVLFPNLPNGWIVNSNATDGGFRSGSSFNLTNNQFFPLPDHTKFVGTNDNMCNCDKSNEQLISPAIVIPASGNWALSFDYLLSNHLGEWAEVRVSTDGGVSSSLVETLADTQIQGYGDGMCEWVNQIVDLYAYTGQTINLIWKYDDNNSLAYGFMLDNINIYEASSVDMRMVEILTDTVHVAGSFNLEGIIQNLGSNPVNAVDIIWNGGSGNQSYTLTTNLSMGDTTAFIHPIPVTLIPGQIADISVSVVIAGDTLPMNNVLSRQFVAVSSLKPKKVVGELRNGSWCGWNPRGDVSMVQAVLDHPNNFIGISIHNGDPMELPAYDNAIDNYIPSLWPTCAVDRIYNPYYVGYQSGLFELVLPSRLGHIPPAGIQVNAATNGVSVTVEVGADMAMSLSGDYRLAVVLVHDSINGGTTGYNQANYYSGGAPLIMPNYGSMANFEFHNAPNPIQNYYHDFVAVAIGSQIIGAANSLPSNLVDGTFYSHTYTIPFNPNWSVNRMRAIGIMVNAQTGEILNAEQGTIEIIGGISESELANSIIVSPNPNNGIFVVSIEADQATDYSISIVNASGQEIHSTTLTVPSAGIFDHAIDLSAQSTGLYVIQIRTDKGVMSKKVNVLR